MTMSLSIRRIGTASVVSLIGEIDLQNSHEVRKELLACLVEHRDVVVDLAKVGYIDSSGVASLIEAYQVARRTGLRFSLAAVSAAAMRVLKLARLDEVFVIHADTDDATKGP